MILKWLTADPGDPKEKWHEWFAWYPVAAFDTYSEHQAKVWLQYVDRKGTYHPDHEGGGVYKWEYKFSSYAQ